MRSVAPLVTGLVALMLSLVAPPLVVGDLLVRPELVTLFCGVAVIVLVVARCRRVRAARPLLAWALSGGLVALVVAVVALRGLLGTTTTYTLLVPAGPAGCRVVVAEWSFLFSGSGRVGTVRHVGFVWFTSDYTADDGGQPVTDGTYSVTWSDRRAFVELEGPPGAPVWPSGHDVGCGSVLSVHPALGDHPGAVVA